jgi:capsular polysaccharide biosynthesis protein
LRVADPTVVAPKSVVLAAVWRARWLILAAVLVAGIGGYFLSSMQPASYVAQSRVVLSATQPFDPLSNQTFADPARFIANQVSVMGTQPILESAANRLDDTTIGDLAGALTVEGSGDTDVITVGASGDTAEEAADRANAVVAAYREYARERVASSAADALTATTDPTVLDRIATQVAVFGDGVEVVEPAFPPGEPASPAPLRDALLLAAVAALLAMGVALFRRPQEQEMPTSSARVLGTVPLPPAGQSLGGRDHALALVALDYARPKATVGAVLVTGATDASGAASVAQGLAAAAVGQGRRVVLIDAQPGARELVRRTTAGRVPAQTLDALARSGESLAGVLVDVPVSAEGSVGYSLGVLGADEDELVDTAAVGQALDRLATSFDLVLVQVAPLSQSPLAFALAGQAEVLVAAVGIGEQSAPLAALQAHAEAAHRPLVGILLTRPLPRGKGGQAAKSSPQPTRTQALAPARS